MRILVKRCRLVLGDRVIERGETVEVDAALGAALLSKGANYERAPEPEAPAAAPKQKG